MAGKNINQLNDVLTIDDADKFYLGRSPYSATDDHAVQWSTMRTAAANAAPVQSVAGKTGVVTLVSTDITDFNTASDARITNAITTNVVQQYGANLQGLANYGNSLTGPIFITGVSGGITTFHTPLGSVFSGTSFNNISNGANYGDEINFSSSSAKTITLDVTGLGAGFYFIITNSGAGAITFAAAGGNTIYGVTTLSGGVNAFTTPSAVVRIVDIGNSLVWFIEPTNNFSFISLQQPSGFTGAQAVSQVAGIQTTNATPTAIASIVVEENECIMVQGTVTAKTHDNSAFLGGNFTAVARRVVEGNVVLVGNVVTNIQQESTTATFSCDADIATESIRILVTGIAATTYDWVTNYTYQKILTNT